MKVREMDIEFYRLYANSLEAKPYPPWRYDEAKPCGADFQSPALARAYDRYHRMFRDYKAETQHILTLLDLDHTASVIDMGCGTGAFTINAAPHCKIIHAVDISKAMLKRARKKAKRAGLTNIEFHHAGHLTYEHNADPVDAVVSALVLHHLPDFWKLIALARLAAVLKPTGRLYLFDVVMSFDHARHESAIEQFIQSHGPRMGPVGAAALETHLRAEYSTCNWIMEGLLERAGFQIQTADYKEGFFAEYLCTKKTG